ncbi:etoposide-induced protein 2.4-domain-containing protein [Flagelloscypha sp. PMI_526]|nr:etoposide-induced protein 2.4-domain-containing protein [Flagelloscypha sp. PMI_526]
MDRAQVAARGLYPQFLSVPDSLYWQAKWCLHGLQDSFQWIWLVSTLFHDAELRSHLGKSLGLNTLCLLSIYVMESLFAPLVEEQTKWIHRHLGAIYNLLWLSPILAASFYLNSIWCKNIAQRTYALQHGNHANMQQPSSYTGMLTAIASSAYRGVMLGSFLLLSLSLDLLPVLGPALSFLFLCWINSYYCFEFLWIARGMSLSGRIRHLEERWSYYLAFGFSSALVCATATGLASVALFALVYPSYIMMAMHSKPVPRDPYNPSGYAGSDNVPIHPSPFIPIRLRIFAPVLWINDRIVQLLSVAAVSRTQPRQHQRSSSSDGPGENIEDGVPITSKYSAIPSTRSTAQRITIGRRKKD